LPPARADGEDLHGIRLVDNLGGLTRIKDIAAFLLTEKYRKIVRSWDCRVWWIHMVLLRARAHHPSLLTVQYHMGWWLPLKKNGMEARSVGLDIRAYLISASSSLVQVVSFLVVELIYSNSNLRFNMHVVFTTNYSFSG
jgi:hypothetical protein